MRAAIPITARSNEEVRPRIHTDVHELEAELSALHGGTWRLVETIPDPQRQDSTHVIVEREGDVPFRAIARMRPGDKDRREALALQSLRDAGFGKPSPYVAPIVIASPDETRGWLVTDIAPGTRVVDLLRQGRDCTAAMQASAEWLSRLHAADIQCAPARGDSLVEFHRWCSELSDGLHDQGTRIADIQSAVLENAASLKTVPSHGDFHPDHVFFDGTRTTVIDFDRFGLRPPADDLGLWLARTATILWREHGSFASSASLRDHFLTTYGRTHSLEITHVGAWMALYLVKSLWFAVAKRSRPHLERVEPLPGAASACLSGDIVLASR